MRTVKGRSYDSGLWIEVVGHFHGWGLDYVEERNDCFGYTYAIVEDANGKIFLINPEDLKFTDREGKDARG